MAGNGGLVLFVVMAAAMTHSVQRHAGVRDMTVTGVRAWGLKPPMSRAAIDTTITRTAVRYGLAPTLFHALVRVESGKNPNAVSHVGAIGLTQVMPANAKRCGLRSPRMLFDPVDNVNCGAKILREELDVHGGDVVKALTVYNCGRVNCPAGRLYAALVLSAAKRNV